MEETWRLVAGGKELFSQPRGLFLRDVMLSHWYQHRGQISVYLRMLECRRPGNLGPERRRAASFHAKSGKGSVVRQHQRTNAVRTLRAAPRDSHVPHNFR